MRNLFRALAVPALLPLFFALGQEQTATRFEVVSVKPAQPGSAMTRIMQGGPGTSDPELIRWHQPLVRVILAAYGVDFDQVAGPDWLGTDFYDITARVSKNTTKEQLKTMWMNLLIDRFAFRAHIGTREYRVYELTAAKGAPKLRAGRADEPPEPGFPSPRAGKKLGLSVVPPRNVRLTFRDYSMAEFAGELGWPLATPGDAGGMTPGRVLDKTGLAGTFNFTLEFAGAWGPQGAFPPPLPDGESDTAPALVDAVHQTLGLQLTEKTAPLKTIFVDFANKTPAQN